MDYFVFYDESGDLGWTFDQPFRKGGSSRYFSIAFLLIPTKKLKYITRLIKKFHKERGGRYKEYKGAFFRDHRARSMARKVVELLLHNEDIKLGAITIQKVNVPIRLKGTGNDDVLYNFLVQAYLTGILYELPRVHIIPDKKSVPSGSQNSCSDLLKTKLWLEMGSNVELIYEPKESHSSDGLIFIDWIANFVWRHYEDNRSGAYEILLPYMLERIIRFL